MTTTQQVALGLLLLAAVCFAADRQPPQLPQTFQADVVADLPFVGKVKGREYYDYTKQFDRLDLEMFGSKLHSYSFYNQHAKYEVDPTTKHCEKKDLGGELFPFFIPPQPLSNFIGETVIDGQDCEHWRINWFGIATVDIFSTNQEAGEGKTLAVLKRAVYSINFMTMTTDFSNIVPGPFDPSVYDISGYPSCNPPPPPATFTVKGFLKNAVNNKLITDSASVVFKNLKTGKESTAIWSAPKGLYEAVKLEAGDYYVVASANGFITTSIKVLSISGSIPEGTNGDIFMSPKLPAGTWRAVLSWGATPRDLDLHMGVPNGCHVYFRSKTCTDAQLDYDVTRGYGPETITFKPTSNGQYFLYVHNYSGEAPFFNSKASVKLYNENGLVQEVIVPTTGYDGKFTIWRVLSVDVQNGTPKVSAINTVAQAKTN